MNKNIKFLICAILIIALIGIAYAGSGTSQNAPGQQKKHTPTTIPTTIPAPTPTPTPSIEDLAKQHLANAKNAIVYERITEDRRFNRSNEEIITILNETHTELILRDFIRWEPVPENSESVIPEYADNYAYTKSLVGYTYEQLSDSITAIKIANPHTILIGAISAQRLNRLEYNEITKNAISQEQTWGMAFDPAKYNLTAKLGNKITFQCRIARQLGWIPSTTVCPSGYNLSDVPVYFPDITNIQYQDLLISRVQKQVDLGTDGIWIDMLYAQAQLIAMADQNNPSIVSSHEASSELINRIHNYGISKGKYVYAGTWHTYVDLPYQSPDIDFVTVSPEPEEIIGGLNSTRWNDIKTKIYTKSGQVPIYAIIDWGGADGGTSMPLTVFSQTLTTEQQNQWLENTKGFFAGKNIVFAFPVHGGTFPTTSQKLAFGRWNTYDSLAPEFNTYSTIRNLMSGS